MSYIIGKACDGVCDTICVKVCPVDCIHGPIDVTGGGREVEGMSKEELKGKQLYINPAECIVGLPPGIIIILSGSTSALYLFLIHLVTACLHSKIPFERT